MQAYLAEKYMSGRKADAILARAAPEKKKKKRKTDAATPSSTHGFGIVDEDGGWGTVSKGADEDEDDVAEAVVASDRSFKKRKVEGEEGSGWATVRESIKREEASPPPDEKPQVVDMPFAGGLVRASELKKRLPDQASQKKNKRSEAEIEREREEERLAQETIYRDASGRKIDTRAERAEATRRKRELEEKEAQKMEWGKGMVQREEAARRVEELEKARNRDLAVYADDEELNEEQKSAMRWDDPAARFLMKKAKKGLRKPEYTGPPPPPNRFAIKPGYRWDGVDRSNGFEKKYFQKLNERRRRGLESYQWSVDDM